MKIKKFHSGRNLALLGAWRFLLFGVLIGLIVFVGAVSWNGIDIDDFRGNEENYHQYNLTNNISNIGSNLSIVVDTSQDNISWDNGTVNFSYNSLSSIYWIDYDSDNFLVNLNITRDNESGRFMIPFLASDNVTAGTLARLWFQVNATNDIPYFLNLNSSYEFPQNENGSYTINAYDEEKHYPLTFNLTFFDNCTHASWSGRNSGENCSIFNLTYGSSSSTIFDFDPAKNDVGTYWANFSVMDFNGSCPHEFCDASVYDGNKSSEIYLLKFEVLSALTIDASNCSGSIFEGDVFNCSIEITTVGENDAFNFSSLSNLTSRDYVGNKSWFYPASSFNAANFSYKLNISVNPGKNKVGNWSVDFRVDDGFIPRRDSIYFFVNYNESNVSLGAIDDLTGSKALYEDSSFDVFGYDDDLLIQDFSVKNEILTFSSNVSWVIPGVGVEGSTNNYSRSSVFVNHSAVMGFGDANYSVNLSVVDLVGNLDWQIFVIEILNDSAPEWNDSFYVFVSNESDNVYINLTGYVSDSDDDVGNLTFSYVNSSRFDSFSLTSEGIINFSSDDVDVGEHLLNISVSDGKRSTSVVFNFTIFNVVDAPVIGDIDPAGTINVLEGDLGWVNITIFDDDFYIIQKSFYNENLTIELTFSNLTQVVSLISFDFVLTNVLNNMTDYRANFTPDGDNVGLYNVTFNVTDVGGLFNVTYFLLNITETNDAPVLDFIDNVSLSVNDVFYLDINASDEEDGNDSSGKLNYSLDFVYGNDFVKGDENIFNSTSGVFNLSLNSSYSGEYHINITVNDSGSPEKTDSQLFYLYVYGSPNITFPNENYLFNWSENSFENFNFSIDYGINNSNLSYEFFLDDIVCYWVNESNGTKDFNYSNVSLRGLGSFIWNSSVNLTFGYLPDYGDESYGMLKNFSLLVYDKNYPELNGSLNWKVNVSHVNENISFNPAIGKKGPATVGAIISVDLKDYFNDSDYFDVYYNQNINFSLETVGAGGYVVLGSSFSDWILNLGSSSVVTETVKVNAYEWVDNVSFGNVSSNDFEVEFIAPVVQSTSGGSSTKTKLKYFSLRIIVPEDVIIDDEDYIEVPFGLENSGSFDLAGINLSSTVLYNNQFSDDVKINLEETYIDLLKSGERRNYTMKILADTTKSGRYKATIFANISSPKFSDWADFFINLKKTNDTEAEKMLIFTEKIISDNPECLELTEVFRRAEEAFESGNQELAMTLAMEVSEACEDAISANEQVRYRIEGFVESNFYYIAFVTLIIFFIGFIVYVWKRVRFNKSEEGIYVR